MRPNLEWIGIIVEIEEVRDVYSAAARNGERTSTSSAPAAEGVDWDTATYLIAGSIHDMPALVAARRGGGTVEALSELNRRGATVDGCGARRSARDR